MAGLATIPPGSWILVTGVNGFLGSHTAKQFLERGYKVRGSVRNLEQSSWLVQDVFKLYVDCGDFELIAVPDLAIEHAFDGAMKGISAVAHIATILTFDADPNKVIPRAVSGTISILEAALKEPSIKSFVYTSSVVAQSFCSPDDNTRIGHDTWNEKALELAWTPPSYDPERAFITYIASKTAAEKALWKFVEDRNPPFNVNTVLPFTIIGQCLNKKHAETPYYFVKDLYEGNAARLTFPASRSRCFLHEMSILLSCRRG